MSRISKYSDEQIIEAVKINVSYQGVMKTIGMRLAGGSQSHLTYRIKKLYLDTSHFTGQGYKKGKKYVKRNASDILILRLEGRRQNSKLLTRALISIGVVHQCSECGQQPTWLGHKLTLDVDHINKNWLDDRAENLRFLCPNCHSQFSRNLRDW